MNLIKEGGSPRFFVKLDFEIAVDRQTRARDRIFKGVPNSGCLRDKHAHILVNFCRAFFIIWPPIFFKGIAQNSTPNLKVEIQFYVDSENS